VALVVLGLGLGACDAVWGLTGEPPRCDLGTGAFDGIEAQDLKMTVEDYSVAVDVNRAIASLDGFSYEIDLEINADPVKLELGEGFIQAGFGLAPEGDFLFFSNEIEPPDLGMAERTSEGWKVSTRQPPKGVHAGTPTAKLFGARRVLVKIGQEGVVEQAGQVRDTQEYVEDGDSWRPVGDRQALATLFAPNLTPNGMTAVFVEQDADGNSVVVIATRKHVSDSFTDRTVIFRADAGSSVRTAQLRGDDVLDKECSTLFVDVGNQLQRFDR
jgi:hypothetical protein